LSALFHFLCSLLIPPSSTLFPYTTLFRSTRRQGSDRAHRRALPRTPPDHRTRSDRREGMTHDLSRRAPPPDQDVQDDHRPQRCQDRKSTRLNSSHVSISYAVFCLKKKTTT